MNRKKLSGSCNTVYGNPSAPVDIFSSRRLQKAKRAAI
jgi:hypothetical protein